MEAIEDLSQVVLDQKAEDYSHFVENDAMLKTAFTEEKTRGCTPTDASYRVLRNADTSCPLEAGFEERTRFGNQGRCCTSSRGTESHPESLDFFRVLRKISANVPVGTDFVFPPSLGRIIEWVNSPENSADIGDVRGDVRITTEHERFMEILKFAMMTGTTTDVFVTQGATDVLHWGNGEKGSDLPGLSAQVLQVGPTIMAGAARVVNDVGVGFVSFEVSDASAGQLVAVPPLRAARVLVGDSERVSCVDLANVVAHFDAGRDKRWIQRVFDVSTCAVVKSSTSIRDQMFEVFRSMRESFTVSMGQLALTRFRTHEHQQEVPRGYIGVSFRERDLLDICLGMRNSVGGRYFHREFTQKKKGRRGRQGRQENFTFECRAMHSRRAVEVHISLTNDELSIGLVPMMHAF